MRMPPENAMISPGSITPHALLSMHCPKRARRQLTGPSVPGAVRKGCITSASEVFDLKPTSGDPAWA